ncbi:PHP domain-containing protein [Carnobacterium sp. ISL-102]|uniref:PHP domain-containing protein n=1 Tax=Carnobacterium sp. ISL-102 TaxID=2819142 RepID=UPI001BEBB34D|nr:PHP domain-containing protein [Carnobacterium sp. ISL-102]MBT2732899.1 histidinol-phosphatase [Carnobacterium sp. ISL-102]
MKKLDLHIHTKYTLSDSKDFDFSIDTLQEYIKVRSLDGIAITNHNHFDLAQYEQICKQVDITVFPGVELDLENGHLLMICENNMVSELNHICQKLSSYITTQNSSLTMKEFKNLFKKTFLNKVVLIPHYKKSPIINQNVIDELNSFSKITAGEVQNHRRFVEELNIKNGLVPVLFSDMRVSQDVESFNIRQTYFHIDEISIPAIKLALMDKNKVSLSKEEGNHLFELSNNIVASTGLNILIGQRSSGKTNLLDEIHENVENTKYIKQFELIEKNEEESKKNFNDRVSMDESLAKKEYLATFSNLLNIVLKIDSLKTNKNIQDYVNSLINNSKYTNMKDSFAKAKLFEETPFQETKLGNLKKLIQSTEILITNREYKPLIEEYVNYGDMSNLIIRLIEKYRELLLQNKIKDTANTIVSNIQAELQLKTTVPKIKNIDLSNIAKEFLIKEKFDKLVLLMHEEKIISRKSLSDFTIETRRRIFEGAGELKSESGKNAAFSSAHAHYAKPFEYLQKLKEITKVEQADFYKFFTKVEIRVLNNDLLPVSGGQRAEFNFLRKIQDSLQYDLLLLDEPESSFDNIFLNEKINHQIKTIAESIPVFVSTHNNTVGSSIIPDFIIHTKRVIENDNASFKIYTGYPSDQFLKTPNGEKISNLSVQLDCLEAGEKTYTLRSDSYEILGNRK